MEPRNIGVFLWSAGKMRSRFLESDAADFVNDRKTFDRWKAYWTTLAESDAIRPKRGKPVPVKDESSVDALIGTQDGNYLLVDAGEMLEAVGRRNLSDATNFLFRELVAPPKPEHRDAGDSLKAKCDALLEMSGLNRREDFRARYPVPLALYGQKHPVHFSFGFGSGVPESLFQRVVLSNELSVNNAAMTLHNVSDQAIVDSGRCAAIYQSSTISSASSEKALKWLERICPVIDVDAINSYGTIVGIAEKTTASARLSSRSVQHTANDDRLPEA